MKNNFFRKNAPVIPTPSTSLGAGSAKRSGGISRLTHDATIKAGAHVKVASSSYLVLAMTVVLLSPVGLAAQNGVTVSNLNVTAGMVTFDVRWGDKPLPALWLDSVWVFVDYNKDGVMKRLPLAPGATLTETSAPGVAHVIQYSDNDKGVWVVGNAKSEDNSSGSFSATVKLLTATVGVSGACAYALNYPPVGEYITSQTVKFTGTPPYDLVFNEGGATTTRQGAYTIPAGKTLASFTDATGAPGTFTCKVPLALPLIASAQGYCEGSPGVTFAMDGTELGVTYQLIKNDMDVVATLSGTGSAEAFDGLHTAGVYTAKSAAGDYCAAAMYGARTVSAYPLPAAPAISSAGTACVAFVLTAFPGADGDGILWENGSTHQVRTVTLAGTYTVKSTSSNGCISTVSASDTVLDLKSLAITDVNSCPPLLASLTCSPEDYAAGLRCKYQTKHGIPSISSVPWCRINPCAANLEQKRYLVYSWMTKDDYYEYWYYYITPNPLSLGVARELDPFEYNYLVF